MFNITGVPGMSGLGMTWNVYSHCWDITDTLLGQFELGLTNGANKKLSSIKGSGYTFEKTGQNDKKPDSGEAGEIKPASEFRTETRSGSKTQSKPTSKHFNDTRAASEYEPYKPSRTTSQAGDSGASITPSPKSPQDYYYAVIKNMALIGLIKTEYVSGGSTWTSTSTSRSTVTDGPWGTVYRAEGDGASIIPSPNSPRVVHQGVVKVVHISGSSTWTSTSTSRSTAIAKPWKTIYRAEGDGASITPSPKFPQMVYYDLVETVHVGGGSTWTSTSTHTATMTGWA
ncbi:hypothetical protein K504DRAFT_458542 [Pleomassaria siparia CBS 279.74]|uniref:Uncharacterized protein n=1 Tax=Pleomassaria siparia CBS 279.74 TaxID=1314801 RepID=A0A6G1K395_9PLEO|nr:hypothetical protein K504DRAFT_458542 [Pleomassaria siparia CBS 279.74]